MYNKEKRCNLTFCCQKTVFICISTHYWQAAKKGNSRGNEIRLYLQPEKRYRIYVIYDLILESKSSLERLMTIWPVTFDFTKKKWLFRFSFPKKEIAGEMKMAYIYS